MTQDKGLPPPTTEEGLLGPEGLKYALLSTPLTQYSDYRVFLKSLYDVLKGSLSSYSYLRFAQDLGLSATNVLWQVITHRRDLSEGSAERISAALALTGDARKYFLLLVRHNKARSPDVREECIRELITLQSRLTAAPGDENILEYFSEWYHPVIREMVGLDHFDSNPDWINERLFLKLTPRKIEHSLKLLESLKLIAFDVKSKRWRLTDQQIFPDRKTNMLAHIRYHQKASEIARESVTGVDPKRRDLNILTLSISDDMLPDARKIIHDSCVQLMKLESKAKKRDQVYQVNIQMFALTTNSAANRDEG